MSSYLPKSMSYLVRRLSGYSRNKSNYQTQSGTTFPMGSSITFNLPSLSLVDVNTLQLRGVFTSTAPTGFAVAPTDIETLISRLDVFVGGSLVSSISGYNHLWKLFCDFSIDTTDAQARRTLLQNAAPLAAAPTANQTNYAFVITNFLGFLGSLSTTVIDTSLYGNVSIKVQLAGPEVLCLSASGVVGSWSISNVDFTVDTIALNDGIMRQSIDAYLAAGNTFEVSFQEYLNFPSTSNSWTQTNNFSVSSQSVNRIFAFFVASAPTGAFDASTGNSNYFTRIGGNGQDATNGGVGFFQFSLAGIRYPQMLQSPTFHWQDLQSIWNHAHDTVGGVRPLMVSSNITNYLNKWSMYGVQFCDSDGNENFVSGLDTRNNFVGGFFQTIAGLAGTAPPSATCQLFVQTTRVLVIGGNSQVYTVE